MDEMSRRENGLIVELASSAKFLGMVLKEHREKAGLSLRQLKELSGVTNSEISKIESGSQSCRLDSLLRICAALGVSVGAVADSVLTVQSFFYEDAIAENSEFIAIAEKRKMAHDQAFFLACALAGFASQLVLSSKPTVIAQQIGYPTEALRTAFLRFANRVESEMRAAARRVFLSDLKQRPIETLKQEGLFAEALFVDYYNQNEREIFNPSTARRFQLSDTTWAAFFVTDEQGGNSRLDEGNALVTNEAVKPILPQLLKRLKAATEARGQKAALAKYLDVLPQMVSQWLSGAREPGGETTLRLLHWVEQQERKK